MHLARTTAILLLMSTSLCAQDASEPLVIKLREGRLIQGTPKYETASGSVIFFMKAYADRDGDVHLALPKGDELVLNIPYDDLATKDAGKLKSMHLPRIEDPEFDRAFDGILNLNREGGRPSYNSNAKKADDFVRDMNTRLAEIRVTARECYLFFPSRKPLQGADAMNHQKFLRGDMSPAERSAYEAKIEDACAELVRPLNKMIGAMNSAWRAENPVQARLEDAEAAAKKAQAEAESAKSAAAAASLEASEAQSAANRANARARAAEDAAEQSQWRSQW